SELAWPALRSGCVHCASCRKFAVQQWADCRNPHQIRPSALTTTPGDVVLEVAADPSRWPWMCPTMASTGLRLGAPRCSRIAVDPAAGQPGVVRGLRVFDVTFDVADGQLTLPRSE